MVFVSSHSICGFPDIINAADVDKQDYCTLRSSLVISLCLISDMMIALAHRVPFVVTWNTDLRTV